MLISELISDLELIRAAMGDLPVKFFHRDGQEQIIQSAGVAGPDDDMFAFVD